MADILPKIKLYTYFSGIQLVINIGVFISTCIFNNNLNIIALFAELGTAFIPLTSVIPLVYSNFPVEVIAFIGVFVSIVSAFQIYLILEITLGHAPTVNI